MWVYLYPVHASLHLQLLHCFPGLGDAGCAVVGDAVLHGTPVGVKGGRRGAHMSQGANMPSIRPTQRPPSGTPCLCPRETSVSYTGGTYLKRISLIIVSVDFLLRCSFRATEWVTALMASVHQNSH